MGLESDGFHHETFIGLIVLTCTGTKRAGHGASRTRVRNYGTARPSVVRETERQGGT